MGSVGGRGRRLREAFSTSQNSTKRASRDGPFCLCRTIQSAKMKQRRPRSSTRSLTLVLLIPGPFLRSTGNACQPLSPPPPRLVSYIPTSYWPSWERKSKHSALLQSSCICIIISPFLLSRFVQHRTIIDL